MIAGSELADFVTESVIVCALDGTILLWNGAAERTYGWTRFEAVGQNMARLLHFRHRHSLVDLERLFLENDGWDGEVVRTHRRGRLINATVRWHVRRDAAGEPLDIVEVGSAERALKRSVDAVPLAGQDRTPAPSSVDGDAGIGGGMADDGLSRHIFHYVPISLWTINSQDLRRELGHLRSVGIVDLSGYFDDHPGELTRLMDLVTVRDVNEQTISLFGGTCVDDFRGPVTRFWAPTPDTFRRSIVAQFNGARTYSEETVVRTLDGRDIDIIYQIAVPPVDDGQAMSIVSVVDIAERVRVHDALKLNEALYRTLFHTMDVALIQLDMRALYDLEERLQAENVDLASKVTEDPGFALAAQELITIKEANARALKLFGVTTPEEIIRPVSFCFQTMPGTFARAYQARLSGASRFSEETRLNTLDGRVVDVLFILAFHPTLVERGVNVVGMIDISDRIAATKTIAKLQAQFTQTSRVLALGELTASIAHEVNQPLSGIMSHAGAALRWLAKDEPDVVEIRDAVELIIKDTERAADIVSRVRDMAANRQQELVLVSPNALVEGALPILRQELVANGVTLDLDVPAELPLVRADDVQIQQVIVNLAMNAMQAMIVARTPDPRLSLRVSLSTAGGVEIALEDNGPGIPVDDLLRIFESFYTTKATGLGIGLSICQRIVEAHRGSIRAENMPGGGSRFAFVLPAGVALPTS